MYSVREKSPFGVSSCPFDIAPSDAAPSSTAISPFSHVNKAQPAPVLELASACLLSNIAVD